MAIIVNRKQGTANRGFTLLIAVIFMAVALSLGLSLASLAYKQEELASSALQSQSAFYAADAGLECALRADQQEDDFDYANYVASAPNFSVACGEFGHTVTTVCYNTTGCANQWVMSWKIPLAFPDPVNQPAGTETSCAVVTIYKPSGNGTTYLFSQGYSVACANISKVGVRFASRGLSASYLN
jgi:Tfp pilus assembly protein PilX